MQQPWPGEPVVISLGGYQRRLAVAGLVFGGLLVFIAGTSLGAGSDSPPVQLAVGALGLAGLGLVGYCVSALLRAQRMRLTVEPQGIRIEAPRRAAAVPWTDLAAVRVSWSSRRMHTVSRTNTCYLDLFPAAPTFAARHPGLSFYWRRNGIPDGYRVLVGSANLVDRLRDALARHAPDLFQGVTQS